MRLALGLAVPVGTGVPAGAKHSRPARRGCLKTQNREEIVPHFSFPGSAWECMTWRLRLHYRLECQTVTGQSPEDMGSQAEPGNQENHSFHSTILAFLGFLRQPPEAGRYRKFGRCRITQDTRRCQVLFFSRLFSKIPIIAQHKKEPQLAKRSVGAAVLQNQNLFAGCISVILFWIIRDNVNDPHVVRIESRCLEKRLLQFRHSFLGYLKDFIPFTKGHSSRRT